MRYITTNFFIMMFFVLGVIPCLGNDPVLERMKPLIKEDTVVVGYVNIETLDTTVILNNCRGLAETLLSDGGIPKEKLSETLKTMTDLEMNEIDRQWQLFLGMAATGKAFLTEMLGIKEAYLVVRIGKAFPAYMYVAIPKTDDLNVAMIEAFKKNNGLPYPLVTRETDDYYFLTFSFITGHNDEQREKNERHIAELIRPTKTTERAEFLTAYETVKDAPIWLLFSSPKYTKKVLAEIKPKLPSPYQDIDIATLVNGLRWKAVRLDPTQLSLNIYAETESDYDTQVVLKYQETFYDLVIDTLMTAYEESEEQLKKEAKYDYSAQVAYDIASAVMRRNTLLGLKKYLMVTPIGNRFELHWNVETVRGMVRDLGIPLEKLLTIDVPRLQESRNKMQCSNNVKRLGLAMHTYADVYKLHLPAAYTVDKEGKPLHSWRVALLPFLEQGDLYSKIKLDEPWDSEYNK